MTVFRPPRVCCRIAKFVVSVIILQPDRYDSNRCNGTISPPVDNTSNVQQSKKGDKSCVVFNFLNADSERLAMGGITYHVTTEQVL